MSNYKILNDRVFSEIFDKFKDTDIDNFRDELLYVYNNEAKYRCQCISQKMSVRHFRFDKSGKYTIENNEDKKETELLPYMNYYEKIDSIFNGLYEKYNYDKFLFAKKQEILSYYDEENSHRFTKCEKINWIVDENGEIVITDKK